MLTVTGSGDPGNPHELGGDGSQPWVLNDDVPPAGITMIVFENPDGIALPENSRFLFSASYDGNELVNLKSIDGINQVNTTNVQYMYAMFYGASSLTSLDLSDWNTTNVEDMYAMFYGASSLTSLDLSDWNTTNVEDMRAMFYGASSLTSLDLSNWNTANVTNMDYMFYRASSLTSLDLSNWNTTNVGDMYGMFYGASSLTSLDLSNWNTTNVQYMSGMFSGASSLASLTIGADTDLTKSANVGLVSPEGAGLTGKWVRIPGEDEEAPSQLVAWWSGTTDALIGRSGEPGNTAGTYIWQEKTPITFNLDDGVSWTNKDPDLTAFADAAHGDLITLPEQTPQRDGFRFTGWKPSPGSSPETILQPEDQFIATQALTLTPIWGELKWGKAPYTFTREADGSGTLTVTGNPNPGATFELDGDGDQPWVLNKANVPPADITKIVLENPNGISLPTDSSYLFSCSDCSDHELVNLKSIDGINQVNTTNVQYMDSMFSEASNLTSLDLSNWNTTNVEDMDSMFWGASSLTSLDLSNWNTTNVEDMSGMFRGASSLIELNLSGWTTTNVRGMYGMFYGASSLASLTIGADTDLTKSSNVGLVSPEGAGLTGKWVRIPGEDEVAPDPLVSWWSGSTDALIERSAEGDGAGTYIWQQKTPITFTLDDGVSWPTPDELDLTAFNDAAHGELITLPEQTPQRDGFRFTGWKPSSGSSPEAILQPGAQFIATQALTLTPLWQPYWGDAPYVFEDGTLTVTGDPENPVMLGGDGSQPWVLNDDVPPADIHEIVFVDPDGIALPMYSHYLFSATSPLNRLVNLELIDGINEVNIGDVGDMSNMFNGASSLTGLDLSGWDTTNVEDMEYMFDGADSLASLTLGIDTKLGSNVGLVSPEGAGLTGKWVRVPGEDEDAPDPLVSWWRGSTQVLLNLTSEGEAVGTYVWQENAPITLDLNGGQWDDPTPDTSSLTTASVGDLISLPNAEPAKEGFTFTGWEQTTPTPEQPALEELFGLEHLLGLMGWDTQQDTLLTPGAQFITTSALTSTAQWERNAPGPDPTPGPDPKPGPDPTPAPDPAPSPTPGQTPTPGPAVKSKPEVTGNKPAPGTLPTTGGTAAALGAIAALLATGGTLALWANKRRPQQP